MSRHFDAWGSEFNVFARKVLQKTCFSQKVFFMDFAVAVSRCLGALGISFLVFLCLESKLEQLGFFSGVANLEHGPGYAK